MKFNFPRLKELKKSGLGNYSKTVTEEGGYIITESKYESYDGLIKYYKTDIRPNKKAA